MSELPSASLDQLFREARTQNAWDSEPLDPALLQAVYELAKWGPTSANASPARFVFVTSADAKAKLAPHLSSNNREKTLQAPVCVIVGYDLAFAEKLPMLFPHAPGVKDWFSAPAIAQETAFRNSSLQGAYFIVAARALGLDCGPMSGFNSAGVDEAFFAGTTIKTNFLVNIGHGKPEGVFPRNPRLTFEEACQIV